MEDQSQTNDLNMLRNLIRIFVKERDWDQFNSPKNLATALCVEAGELLEPFQWLKTGGKEELGAEKLAEVRLEMADVLIYLIYFADKLDIDLIDAVVDKMHINRTKYPAEKVRGDARKYTDYK
jgi:NTP pyrophosphatase (non-canonical NTP hydrolase)